MSDNLDIDDLTFTDLSLLALQKTTDNTTGIEVYQPTDDNETTTSSG